MKLYEIEKGSRIYCELNDGSTFLIFNRIDGMYSYCTTEKGVVTHLGATTELAEYKDGYKITN